MAEEGLLHKLTAFLNSCTIKPQWSHFTWDKVIGSEDAKRELYRNIVLPHKLLELPRYYEECKIPTPGDVMLEGEPGTGKTKMAYTAASTCKVDFFCQVNCVEMFANFGIESSLFIRLLFQTAKKHKRSVIYFRNMDCFEYDCNWIILPAKSELKYQMEFWQERFRFVQGRLESLSVIGAARNAHTSMYDKDWKILVDRTDGFTGRQLKTLCQNVVKTAKVYTLSAESQDTEQICISLDSFSRWVSINQSVQQQKDCQTLRSLVTG
ncbi:uncharacterized protein LOC110847079 isoform X2 [Folsomia candida]|uniref:uncharacterized protein LOC110847079 isoform X2 n=1 Tax=Folsomia candida TaxID=158441 RepID=UPI000B900E88|nr:uncharacterized protein LOC110847079 isoform X2 [Folsomia candida]